MRPPALLLSRATHQHEQHRKSLIGWTRRSIGSDAPGLRATHHGRYRHGSPPVWRWPRSGRGLSSSIDALAAFYSDVIGLPLIEADPRPIRGVCACRAAECCSSLIAPTPPPPGRQVPSHGAEGAGHVAFRVENLDAWRDHLTAHRVAIEREIHWEAELASIYVRDPAGNSVELANGELWE
jgi:catechol 2,3-dioxygenase-like lactoylglutathione lyase family enzyme